MKEKLELPICSLCRNTPYLVIRKNRFNEQLTKLECTCGLQSNEFVDENQFEDVMNFWLGKRS